MALETNDLMLLKSLSGNEMTPYEQFKTQHMQAKSQTSGLGIAGLTVGVGAAVLAIGGAAWAGSRAQNAKDVAIAKNDGLRDLVQTLADKVYKKPLAEIPAEEIVPVIRDLAIDLLKDKDERYRIREYFLK